MGAILTNQTAVRLVALLDKQGPAPARTLPASRSTARPESDSTFDAPFTVRWSEANASWIIYLPPQCAVFAVAAAEAATVLEAAEDLEGWYKFAAPATGTVFVWIEKAAGAADDWWGSWSTARLNAGQTLPDAAAAAGAFIPVASVDTTNNRVKQIVSSCLRLMDVQPDYTSIEIAYDANGYPITQLYGFNSDDVTSLGLSECLAANPETGELSVKSGDQYRLVVQIVSESGNVLGYMPLGAGDGEDPSAGETSECGHDGPPGGGADGGGGGIRDDDETENQDVREPPGGGDLNQTEDRDSDAFPSKTGPCW